MSLAFLRNSVVKFTIRGTRLNPRAVVLNINAVVIVLNINARSTTMKVVSISET
jgi:hypothetical protein